MIFLKQCIILKVLDLLHLRSENQYRIFVIDGKPAAEDEPSLADFKKAFINAHITEKSGELMPMNEGCLSIPNLREEVLRESHIRINIL